MADDVDGDSPARQRCALAYCFACWIGAAIAMAALDLRLGALFGVYPVLLAAVAGSDVGIDRAYSNGCDTR